MTKTTVLDRVYLKTACSTEWSLMEGSEQIRFCSECDKYVYNLSSMTRKQAEDLIERADGLCAKFDRDDRGDIITSDQLKYPSHFSVRLPRFAGTAMATLLGIGLVAQTEVSSRSNGVIAACFAPSKKSEDKIVVEGGKSTIAGTVFDVNKAVIVGATVTLINEQRNQEQRVATSDEGQYRLEKLEPGNYTIKIESRGFVSFKKSGIELQSGSQLRIDVTLQVGTMGGLAILPESDKSSPTIIKVLSSPIRGIKRALGRTRKQGRV